MSAIKLGHNYKYKDIIIKNTIKIPNNQFKPQFNPSSSFIIRNRVSRSKQKTHKPSMSNSNGNSFSNDIMYKTFRASSNNRKISNEVKKIKNVVNFINGSNKMNINNEYYSLPVINQPKYTKVTQKYSHRINRNHSNSRQMNNGNFLRISNNSRQVSLLSYNNPLDNSSKNNSNVIHNKNQSISYENCSNFFNKMNPNNISIKVENDYKKKYKTVLLKYACKRKAGYTTNGTVKTNQDNFMVKSQIFGLSNYSVYGVFDGHGTNGHFVSKFLKEHFGSFFTNKENYSFSNDKDINEKKCYERLNNTYFVKQACFSADEKLKRLNIDTKLSGSTGVMIAHIEDKLMCFNVGDSRAIYLNDSYEPIQISIDHKPNLQEEQSRIINSGGRVSRLPNYNNIGPYRVWQKNEDIPGLAMSRSFGDFIAKGVGVICEPDFFEINIIEKKVKCVIIASDGLYEFISNQLIAAIVTPFIKMNDCVGASKKLVEEAYREWTKDGMICDDITVIVLFFRID